MGEVIQFPGRASKEQRLRQEQLDGRDKSAKKLMQIADDIDAIIVKYLDAGDVDPHDLAGLMAHRLGTLMRHLEQKGKLWDVCERVLKTQAAIE